MKDDKEKTQTVVVIGSGIAGLSAAYAAAHATDEYAGETDRRADPARVILVCKDDFTESNTLHAQGGIAAAIFDDDSPALHAQDTLAAGDGLCDPKAVEILTAEGRTRVNELIARGVHFDKNVDGSILRGLEAAHSRARVVHAGGDATGKVVELDVAAIVRNDPRIEIREHTFVTDLCIDDDGRCTGVLYISADADAEDSSRPGFGRIDADRVILATGGAGQMYPYTTNPDVATADGVALALAAGAQVADLEFYQFHPTALAMEDNFLVSEAVRGEGAQLFNERGERYMTAVDPRAELAPRDVVARENFRQMMAQSRRPVLLDARPIGEKHPDVPLAEFLAKRFPTIDAYVRAHGYDWSQTPIPVTPAAHYYMGGIRTDYTGRTSIRGLWAAGECARTGVHGANRLASNSLLEGLVYGHRAGIDAATANSADLRNPAHRWWTPGSLNPADNATGERAKTESDHNDGVHTLDMQVVAPHDERGFIASLSDKPYDSDEARRSLQKTMWDHMGVLRTAQSLETGIAALRAELGKARLADRWSPRRGDDATAEYRYELARRENVNLATVALAASQAALARTESRGAHAREDFPETDPSQARSVAWAADPAAMDY